MCESQLTKWLYEVFCVFSEIESDHPLADPAVKARELFCSEATDTYPVTALR